VAGNGTAGDAGAELRWGELYNRKGLALDSAGNLYIADTQNHRIRMLTPGGAISTIAGTGTERLQRRWRRRGGRGAEYPSAVAVDAAGTSTSRTPATTACAW
jgi:hypothetical protein